MEMMREKVIFVALAAFAPLVFVGVGCGPTNVAIPADEVQNEFALTDRNYDLSALRNQDEPAANIDNTATGQPESQMAAPDNQPMPDMMDNDKKYEFPGRLADERIMNKKVTVKTAKGDIEFDLLAREAPLTVSNFVYLAEQGYFDGLTFHRVVPGFVIQGGDPGGDGRGGPGYKFEDEPVNLDYRQGTVAMANAGPNTNGSQFFICLEDQPTLPKSYTIFGQVTSGMDIVKKIAVDDVMTSVVITDK